MPASGQDLDFERHRQATSLATRITVFPWPAHRGNRCFLDHGRSGMRRRHDRDHSCHTAKQWGQESFIYLPSRFLYISLMLFSFHAR